MKMTSSLAKLKKWLGGLSFRTGIILLVICVMCYLLSFAQMLLPISLAVKGVLWTIFFGLAKATQYTVLLIIGKDGVVRLRRYFRGNPDDKA